MEDSRTPHIAILPSPGMGHFIPLAEFARRLVLHHNFSVTFLSISTDSSSNPQQSVVDALPKNVNSIQLPPITLNDLPADSKIETHIISSVARSLPGIRDVLKSLVSTSRLVALVVDLFGMDAFDVAREFGIPPYIFFPPSAMALSFCLHLPTLDEQYACEYRDIPEPLKLPGCVPLHGKDFLDPIQDRKHEVYGHVLRKFKRYNEAKGILVNSFVELEPGPIKALKEKEPGIPAVYPVGPLIQTVAIGGGDGSECLRWLDEQPRGSVLFVCFGSGGTLSLEQVNELALGLEMSEQRFLWVARSPSEKKANATFFGVESNQDPLAFLPKGFLSRTKGVGHVIPSWAPQIQVLSHESTGGFLTHCGWNSTLESIVHGVPMIAWPLYAEQKMNAVMMVEDLKVALRPTDGESGIVGRAEIARVVKGLMEGEEGKRLRRRMVELKYASTTALAEGGSSYKAMFEVAHKWKGIKDA
ncbi:hydroquinone glucosyltransferase-like [Magnolia sinica]|uniref:hydroquinone glucosyltransferase-like n=1 Tax=Magnolia sinica TaxID=86752 RepID=UPI00265A87D8|nr:hydroquinone glucosyltransferase-like [Magnolia sinica]